MSSQSHDLAKGTLTTVHSTTGDDDDDDEDANGADSDSLFPFFPAPSPTVRGQRMLLPWLTIFHSSAEGAVVLGTQIAPALPDYIYLPIFLECSEGMS